MQDTSLPTLSGVPQEVSADQTGKIAPRSDAAIAVLFVLACLFLFYNLNYIGLTSPDEARYSEVAREMLATGDWIVPHINGEPRINKPPFTYWALAAAYRLFGLRAGAGRLVPALCALVIVLMVVILGNRFAGRTAGLLGGTVTATSVLFLIHARLTTTDMVLCMWLTLTVASGFLALAGTGRNAAGILAFFIFAAGGAVTKGPVALLLPGLIVLAFCAWTRRWDRIHWPAIMAGLVLFAGLAAPWYIRLEHALPGALRQFFLKENVTRFAQGVDHTNSPAYYFPAILLLGALPWTAVAPAALWRSLRVSLKETTDFDRQLLMRAATLWCWIPFIFFSLSRTKLPSYILPCFPPMGLMIGVELARQLHTAKRQRRKWNWVHSQGVLLLLLTVGLVFVAQRHTEIPWTALRRAVTGLGSAGIVGGGLLLVVSWSRPQRFLVPLVVATYLFFMATLMNAFSKIEHFEYVAPLVARLHQMGEPRPDTPVVTYYCREPALPFYLQRVVPDFGKGDFTPIINLVHSQGRVLCGVRVGEYDDLIAVTAFSKQELVRNNDMAILALTNNDSASSLRPKGPSARSQETIP